MSGIYLILDNIRSMHNVGAIFRTCDGAGVDKLYLCGITACPPRSQIEKTALGATASVEWKYYKSTLNAIRYLKSREVGIIALEQHHLSSDYKLFNFKKPLAIVVGNEIEGVSKRVLEACDSIVHIPMHGNSKSLNVATSAGVILFHIQD